MNCPQHSLFVLAYMRLSAKNIVQVGEFSKSGNFQNGEFPVDGLKKLFGFLRARCQDEGWTSTVTHTVEDGAGISTTKRIPSTALVGITLLRDGERVEMNFHNTDKKSAKNFVIHNTGFCGTMTYITAESRDECIEFEEGARGALDLKELSYSQAGDLACPASSFPPGKLATALAKPETVTVKWLIENVPAKLFLGFFPLSVVPLFWD